MHCELVVPGLFSQPPAARHAGLELLLARGRATSAASQSLERWLHDAFGLEDEAVAAGALTLIANGGDAGDASWARADPVHLRLMRDRLIVAPSAAFSVKPEEAHALCETLTRHFAGTAEFSAPHPERWCARFAEPLELDCPPPLEVAGRDVDLCLSGSAAATRLLNEAQMLLHAHPVNEAREARGEPAINSVWLWGAGRAPRQAESRWQSVAGDDPVALGLARLAGARQRSTAPSAESWLERLPEDGRHLAVLDALRAPLALAEPADYRQCIESLEKRWFEPLLEALRAGRVGMVTIHVPDAAQATSFETIRGDLRRFWRRPRALEHYA